MPIFSSAVISRLVLIPPAAMTGWDVARRSRPNHSRFAPVMVPSRSTSVHRNAAQYGSSCFITSSARSFRRRRQPWVTMRPFSVSRATTIRLGSTFFRSCFRKRVLTLPSRNVALPMMICSAPQSATPAARDTVRIPPPTRTFVPYPSRALTHSWWTNSSFPGWPVAASRSMMCSQGYFLNLSSKPKTSATANSRRRPCTSWTACPS